MRVFFQSANFQCFLFCCLLAFFFWSSHSMVIAFRSAQLHFNIWRLARLLSFSHSVISQNWDSSLQQLQSFSPEQKEWKSNFFSSTVNHFGFFSRGLPPKFHLCSSVFLSNLLLQPHPIGNPATDPYLIHPSKELKWAFVQVWFGFTNLKVQVA